MSIPKIIHYCWLSDDHYPQLIKNCIDSWHKFMPDYEYKLWNTQTFDVNSIPWVKQAYETKKYAFAADYIRLFALYTEGGIYLDSDVLVYKSFNDLLNLPYFIGQDIVGAFEPAIIGAIKGLEWIKHVMGFYNDKNFINPDKTYNFKNLPVVFFESLFPRYGFKRINRPETFDVQRDIINLFPYEFFNGRNNVGPYRFPESYSSHLFANSWSSISHKKCLRNYIPRPLLNFILGLNYHYLRKNKVHQYDPIYRKKE